MRFPFVGRARYALIEHNMEEARRLLRMEEMRYMEAQRASEARADSWKAMYDAERVRNERLVEKLLAMKQTGFTTATDRQATPAQPPSKIEDAITERAGGNGALRRHLSRWAAQRQSMNVPEEEILDALMKWKDPDSEGAEA
jgi:hypothetical protein